MSSRSSSIMTREFQLTSEACLPAQLRGNPHSATLEEGPEVLGVDSILSARSGEGLEVAVANPVYRGLVDNATEIGDFQRGEYPDFFG